MEIYTIEEIVNKLIGDITPVGDEGVDSIRLENLKHYGELIDRLVSNVDDIAYKYRNSNYSSIKNLVNEANKILDKLGIEE
jgi:uncharacterized protein YaaR (DUF327 family)